MSDINIRLGLIGGGYWGKNLIREFNNCGILDTICEINIDAIKQYNELYPNVKTTTKWQDILESTDINAVCISLPAEMHYKFAKEALENNKDVFVEKPITLDVNEADELVDIAKERGLILMVGHLLHYHPCIVKIKELINNGELGKVKNITSNRLNLGKFRSQENVLWSFAPHDISVVLALCGSTLPTSYECTGIDHLQSGIHDVTNSILKFNDIYVNINVNWLNPFKEQKMTIICERGMIVFDDTKKENKLELYKDYISWDSLGTTPTPNKNECEYVEYETISPLYNECLHFIDFCKTRTTPITDGEEGVRVLKVLNNLHSRLINNSKVNVDDYILKKEYFAHETAIIDEGANIGDGTKIWHYSHICKGARIGKNCNIGQNVFIAGDAIIGDHCKVQNNVSIYAGVEAEDYIFFGPSCVLTNDINPRGMYSKKGTYIKTKIETGATLGANCTIVCGNTLGKHCLIGSGAVICKDVEQYSIMVGNPGKKIGEIDEKGERIIY